MYKLRYYQQEASDIGIKNLTKTNPQPFVLQLATGAGKSLIIADMAHKLDGKVLVLQPSKELVIQNHSKMMSYEPDFEVGIYSASAGSKVLGRVTYATIGSIVKKPELFMDIKYVIMDECFVAGTKIDGKNIEDIKPGDLVKGFNHSYHNWQWTKVVRVSKKSLPNNLYRVKLNDNYIIGTGDHPYYVKGVGYIKAKDLVEGDIVYAVKEQPYKNDAMQLLQSSSRNKRLSSVLEDEKDRENISQKVRPFRRGRSVITKNEGEQPDGKLRNQEENEQYFETHKAQATYSGWKWSRVDQTSKDAIGLARRRLVYGVGGENLSEATYVPTPLQNRHSESDSKNSGGSRWEQPLLQEGPGQSEDRTVRKLRVESVEVHQLSNTERCSKDTKHDYVYNIETENYHNYFANGVLVHNCHLLNPGNKNGMYTKFLRDIGCNRVCGLTATPYRLVQRFYFDNGQKYYTAQLAMANRIHPFYFKSIAYKIETKELIDKGYLCPILYRNVDMGDMDCLKVNSTGQDYTAESLEEFWSNDGRLKRLASVIEKIDKHCQRNLIFCSSIRQATRAREMLCAMGISAEMVTGSTSDKERVRLVQDYRDGKFKHMLNVGVFTTGFDVPELDSIVLGRATMSLSLYYQMVGRGVRIDPDRPEKKLRVYDVVQVVKKLGRVETITVRKEIDVDTGKPTWLDEVVSEAGTMSNVPLFTFAVTKK